MHASRPLPSLYSLSDAKTPGVTGLVEGRQEEPWESRLAPYREGKSDSCSLPRKPQRVLVKEEKRRLSRGRGRKKGLRQKRQERWLAQGRCCLTEGRHSPGMQERSVDKQQQAGGRLPPDSCCGDPFVEPPADGRCRPTLLHRGATCRRRARVERPTTSSTLRRPFHPPPLLFPKRCSLEDRPRLLPRTCFALWPKTRGGRSAEEPPVVPPTRAQG